MFKKILIIILFVLLFCNITGVNAQEAMQVELSLSSEKVAVGDSFQLKATLKNASVGNLDIGNIQIPGVEKFQKIGSSESTQIQVINGASTAVTKITLTLSALNEGQYIFGPIKTSTKNIKAESNTVTLNVLKKQKKSFFDNQPKKEISKNINKKNIKNLLVNVAAFLLLIFLIFKLYKQKQNAKKNKENYQQKVASSSDDLSNIFNFNLSQLSDEEFFGKVKNLFLKYIQKTYSIDTKASTSSEIIEKLNSKNLHSNMKKIKKVLELCDQGSFAFNKSGREELTKIIRLLK